MINKRPLPIELLTFADSANAKGQLAAERANGLPARAFLTAPQDEALCMLGAKRRGARQGYLCSVEVPGPDRRQPVCPHFGFCGGCAYQHLSYDAQLRLKTEPLEKKLLNVCPEVEILPAQPAPSPWYYRSKVEFSFIGERLGFNIRGLFQKLTDVRECFIGPPANKEVLRIVRSWQKRYAFPGWDPKSNSGFLRYLVIRHSFAGNEFLVSVITTTPAGFSADDPASPMHELAEELMRAGAAGVIHALNDSVSPTADSQRDILLAGRESIVEKVNDLELSLGWKSFFQSNPPAYALMLRQAAEFVGAQENVLDLYCGVGSIGLSLPGSITGVEIVGQAVEHARLNAQKLGRQAEFHCGSSEDWPNLNSYGLLVLDPPRSGCSPKLIKRLPAEGPRQILYISCNPPRFFEEYEGLREFYRLEKARIYDFFPHTPHAEMMTLLSRKN
ncbi:23S rRNA (uracil(1939)-C(5))-methyltransferase RlmD [bacterium]|nr:23S rRNA (uracil(1939)-C(5))-methyltransferase RlmD [bacterium]